MSLMTVSWSSAVEVLELAEALEEPLAVEGDVFGEVAGDEVVDRGIEGLGELEQGLERRGVKASLVRIEPGRGATQLFADGRRRARRPTRRRGRLGRASTRSRR